MILMIWILNWHDKLAAAPPSQRDSIEQVAVDETHDQEFQFYQCQKK